MNMEPTNKQNHESIDTAVDESPVIDENMGICLSSGLKIVDIDSKEVILQIRGD